jgi:hypothetical protein
MMVKYTADFRPMPAILQDPIGLMPEPLFDCPAVTPELVKYLQEAFPNRCPDPSWNERRVWMAAGAANVVEGLRMALLQQQREATTTAKDQEPDVLLLPADEGARSAAGASNRIPEGPGNRS